MEIEKVPPEVEAAIITAASNWAIFIVGRCSPSKQRLTIEQQLLKAFQETYHAIYLNVREYLPHPL